MNLKTHHRDPNRNEPAASVAGCGSRCGPKHTPKSPSSDHSMLRTACGPSSSTKDLIQRTPGTHTARQKATRMLHGSSDAETATAPTSASHASHRAAAKREAFRSIRKQYATQGGVSGVGGDIARQQIACDIRVGQFEKFDERRAFVTCRPGVTIAKIPQEQEVEFLHAAAAPPLQFAECGVQSVLTLQHHLLDLGDGLGRIQIFRARLGAIHDGVAAIQAERIFELVESFAGGFIA